MADVHLGARHDDLGPAAAAQRERQFAAFRRAVDVAIGERVDLVLICGDLFDSNYQPRRSVERAAAEIKRLVDRHISTVLIPGTHDCYDGSSIYRVFDFPQLAGVAPDSTAVVVLTDARAQVTFPELDTTVHARVFPTKQGSASPLAGFKAAEAGGGTRWQIGMIHGSMLVPGKVENDDVLFTEAEVAASGLHYLALGHWHSFREGRAGGTTWAYAGAPEPVALDQDGAGQVLLVNLHEVDGRAVVQVEPKPVGQTKTRRVELDAAGIGSQSDLVRQLSELADKDLVLDARLVGVSGDALELHLDEVEQQLQGAFLRLRIRDQSVAALPEGPVPPADTIAGAFVRDLQGRIEADGGKDPDGAAELREALRLGRLLLEDPQRVTLV
jgi:DNA repair exonuclease SbcCD nuclease subunit